MKNGTAKLCRRVTFSPDTKDGDVITYPRIADCQVVSIGGRRVARYLVQCDPDLLQASTIRECGSSLRLVYGVWHRYSDFERLSLYLHRQKARFPRSLRAWYKVQSAMRPWRCVREDYLRRKAEMLSAFIQELATELEQERNHAKPQIASSSRSNSITCSSSSSSSSIKHDSNDRDYVSSDDDDSDRSTVVVEDSDSDSDERHADSPVLSTSYLDASECVAEDGNGDEDGEGDCVPAAEVLLVGQQHGGYEQAFLHFCGACIRNAGANATETEVVDRFVKQVGITRRRTY